MRLYLFPPSSRALGVVALKNHVALDCELRPIDLGRGDQRAPDYVTLNPNQKMPTLQDGGFVLWESNAILFYLASKRPERALWPEDVRGQADVMRWLAWQTAHWDAESCGMVAFEKGSRAVLGLGERLTIADFSIGALVPTAHRMELLPIGRLREIGRWYERTKTDRRDAQALSEVSCRIELPSGHVGAERRRAGAHGLPGRGRRPPPQAPVSKMVRIPRRRIRAFPRPDRLCARHS